MTTGLFVSASVYYTTSDHWVFHKNYTNNVTLNSGVNSRNY